MRVQPVLYSPKGFAKPRYAKDHVYAAFLEVADWYVAQNAGAFKVNLPISMMGSLTWEEMRQRYNGNLYNNGFNLWRDAMNDIGKRLNLCVSGRALYLIYFHPPLAEGNGNPTGLGGMVGGENWGCSVLPGTACMADRMVYLLCGLTAAQIDAMGWPPSWPDSSNHPKGGIAHELGHCFALLPHVDLPGSQVMQEWYDWPNCSFTEEERDILQKVLSA